MELPTNVSVITATLICPLTYSVGRTCTVVDVEARGYNVMFNLIKETFKCKRTLRCFTELPLLRGIILPHYTYLLCRRKDTDCCTEQGVEFRCVTSRYIAGLSAPQFFALSVQVIDKF